MISEIDILFGIKNFQQRRRGIALIGLAELVDFVQHDDGIAAAADFHGFDDLSGQGANVRAAMAFDFRFVTHAAEGETEEFPSDRFRNAVAERGLADAGRADEADDGAVDFAFEFRDTDEFENPFFDVFEAEMVAIENAAGDFDIKPVVGHFVPRKFREPIQIVARDRIFGGLRRQEVELVDFILYFVDDFFRNEFADFIQSRLIVVFVGLAVMADSKLLFDVAHLFAEDEFMLLFGEPSIHFA